jgi:hypothetical protein
MFLREEKIDWKTGGRCKVIKISLKEVRCDDMDGNHLANYGDH